MSALPETSRRPLAGAMALALAIGIGRFAYTALLPSAQRGVGFGDAAAGAIAALNLLAYLAGVLVARGARPPALRDLLLRVGLGASVLTTLGTALAGSVASWLVVRTAAGLASGLVFVLASAAVLETASGARAAGVLYAGVGTGIALSGAAAGVPALAGSWRAPWLLLGLVAAALALPGWRALEARAPPPAPGGSTGRAELRLDRLAAAYFLEGLGYIVSGTFAVAAAQRLPAVAPFAPWVWALAGLAAAPSAALWAIVGRRVGERGALVAAMALQAAGMALPTLRHTPGAALAGAALFGGTFMGITTLAMAAARRLDPARPARTIGTLTALYGVGQALGPLLAGAAADRLGDSRPAVLAAAAAVGVGALVLAWPVRRARRRTAREEDG